MKSAFLSLAAMAIAVGGCREPAPAGGTASAAELYQLCASCHGTKGEGNESVKAPAIAGLPAWYVERQLHQFKSGIRGKHPDDITGMQMRPMAVSLKRDIDIKTVSEHVSRMYPTRPKPVLTGGDATRGEALYGPCTACHGLDGAGNQATSGPPLKGASDWYLLSQLHKFKSGVRGANPEDKTGATMRPMAMAIADEQAMKDIVAYIATLK